MNYKELVKLSTDYANAHKAEYIAWYTARYGAEPKTKTEKEEKPHENHTG